MMLTAKILKGKTVHPDISLVIGPGSKQVLNMIAQNGALADMIAAGARILESACGPCIGMGQAPRTNAVSLRTNNRNFEGRSGTASAGVYIVSPETAAVSALTGVLTDPRTFGEAFKIDMPKSFLINDNMIDAPADEGENIEVVRGPNIKPFPVNVKLPEALEGKALIKVGDNITTDHIMPSNAKLLPYRSNIPYLSEFCLVPCDPDFPKRAKEHGGGFIIGGVNYGQGSSREHAALVPLYLGIKAVIAKSFARIHMANLINSGIIPLTFNNEDDYGKISEGDVLLLDNIRENIKEGKPIVLKNKTKNISIPLEVVLSERQRNIILEGGLLNYTKKQSEGK
jgi:aconitate hydratase